VKIIVIFNARVLNKTVRVEKEKD